MDKKDMKFLLGAVLFEGGIIGFVGWAIACSNLVQPGARSDLFSLFGLMDLPNGLIWLGFAVMAVFGLVLCVKTLFNKE